MKAQPLIAVHDVPASSRWYQAVLWFRTEHFDEAWARIRAAGAEVLEEPKVNPSAGHREVWLKDRDGYVVVIAGRFGDLGSGEAR